MKHLLLIVPLLFAACTKADFQTPLVAVQTPAGAVKCQLYTRDTVLWDEAVEYPATYTKEEADAWCRLGGATIMNEARAL